MKFVYIVNKNSDFIEGRGRMLLDKVFMSFDDAYKYIQDHDGIFGSPQDREAQYGDKVTHWIYNGYDIKKVQVFTYETASENYQKQLKEKALSKLSLAEKVILGLNT